MPLVIHESKSARRLGLAAGKVEIQAAIVEEDETGRILFDAAVQVAPPTGREASSCAHAQVEAELRFCVTGQPVWVELSADVEAELRVERRFTGPVSGAGRIEVTAQIQDAAANILATKRVEDWLTFEGRKRTEDDSSRTVRLEPGTYTATCKAEVRAQAGRPGKGFTRAVLRSGIFQVRVAKPQAERSSVSVAAEAHLPKPEEVCIPDGPIPRFKVIRGLGLAPA
ncbi:MAG TPA: hypothetical protein VE685_04325, partial [Thermoanaerobaculia bacterium]|nr:hypothetical protein [Thermoanaerobaculia bacterium]